MAAENEKHTYLVASIPFSLSRFRSLYFSFSVQLKIPYHTKNQIKHLICDLLKAYFPFWSDKKKYSEKAFANAVDIAANKEGESLTKETIRKQAPVKRKCTTLRAHFFSGQTTQVNHFFRADKFLCSISIQR